MGKTTKRSRKFIAKGGPTKALAKKGSSLTKKGKTKRHPKKRASSADGQSKKGAAADDDDEDRSDDFTDVTGIGQLDMDSFFEKAVGMMEKGDDGEASDDEDGGGEVDGDDADGPSGSKSAKSASSKKGSEGKSSDGDEDGDDEVDSLASLGSEESDIEASEARLKEQLAKLSKDDPEFHTYLKENEEDLLEFNMDDDSVDDEYEQDEDAMEEELKRMRADEDDDEDADEVFARLQKESNNFLLTPARLGQLEQSAFESHSVKGLKRIISAYKTACHLSDASQDDESSSNRKKFQITSPVVFDRLMAVALANCHKEFHHHLFGGASKDADSSDDDDEGEGDKSVSDEAPDENKPLHPKTLEKSPHFAALRPLIESFLKSTLHLLDEAGKEAKLLQFTLQALAKYVPYLTVYPRIVKPLLKTSIKLWSAPLDTSEEYNAVRLQAFLRIRQLAITQPYPFIEDVLKLSYLSYAKRSKFGTASGVSSVLPTLTFMGNCIVELYSLDYASSYQHTFVYVRQLALHLRSALMKQTPETRGAVLCWQYVHCLKLWVAVLCACAGNIAMDGKLGGGAGKDDEAAMMRSLVYPVTEIILGVVRLVPVARFVPLRLHCVRLLQQLAASTETFIPTSSLLMGVLDLKEISMKPQREGRGGNKSKSAVRGLRLPLILKLPKDGTLRTTEQLDSVLKETFVLLNREVDLYRYSPGVPEFTFAISQRLRKFNKEINNGRWRAYSKGTIELCEKYSAFAMNGRSTLPDAPKDVKRLEALKPTGTPSMRERYESAIAKEKRLEAAAQPKMKKSDNTRVGDEKKRKGDKNQQQQQEGSGEDADAKSRPSKKRKNKKAVVNQADLKNVDALKEEDDVQVGIEWSDSD